MARANDGHEGLLAWLVSGWVLSGYFVQLTIGRISLNVAPPESNGRMNRAFARRARIIALAGMPGGEGG